MKRSLTKVTLGALMLGASLLAPLAPAQAVADPGCRDNSVCVWDHRAFGSGGAREVHGFRTPYVGNRMNDKISSYRIGKSTTQYRYVMFYEHSYSPRAATGWGPSFHDRHNHGIPYLHEIRYESDDGKVVGNWEDRISSYDEAS